MISRILLAAAITLVGVSASAGPVVYECQLSPKGKNKGFIGEKMFISIDQNGQIIVTDGFIQFHKQDPIVAKVTRNTDQVMKLRWSLHDLRTSTNQLVDQVKYEASLNKKTNKIGVNAEPAGWPGNRFSGKGTCVAHTS